MRSRTITLTQREFQAIVAAAAEYLAAHDEDDVGAATPESRQDNRALDRVIQKWWHGDQQDSRRVWACRTCGGPVSRQGDQCQPCRESR